MNILLVEDDLPTGQALKEALSAQHYIVDLATDGTQGLAQAESFDYDLVVLDILIPKLDGISLCRHLRAQGHQMPILLLTAKDTSTDRVLGLDAGADDYVVKPFDLSELLARMRALIRRSKSGLSSIVSWENLQFDTQTNEIKYRETLLKLTPKEYGILELLLLNPRRIHSRSAILDRLWDIADSPGEDTVTTHIKALRQKLKSLGAAKDLIETVYGLGYRLKPLELLGQPETPFPQSANSQSANSQSAPPKVQPNPDDFMVELWEKFKDTFLAQVENLVNAAVLLSAQALTPEVQLQAKLDAHKLAGSLGVYGYAQGSTLARQIEQLLKEKLPWSSSQILDFSEWVGLLQQELQHSPVMEHSSPSAAIDCRYLLMVHENCDLVRQFKAEAIAKKFRVETAADITIARTLLSRRPTDLVLLDLSSPETRADRLLLLQELSEKTRKTPVIVMTADSSLAERVEIARLGGRTLLQQPVTCDRIFRTIAQVLDQEKPVEGKVLAVDDDPAILASLKHLLEPWGLQVTTLNDPQRFWDTLEDSQPDLLILDVEMPTYSGIELCQVVRSDPRWGDRPVLFLTAHTDAELIHQAFAVGADDYIRKPIIAPELVTRIISRMDRIRLLRQSGGAR